jgi:trehalose 6-phosphate phosphatase
VVSRSSNRQQGPGPATSSKLCAAVFDLDGVVTFTARVHEAAWKELFDTFFASVEDPNANPGRPFDMNDYHLYVDGRPRYDGVQNFLRSRGISLPFGDPSDPPHAMTVCGLGNRKNSLFRVKLKDLGLDVDREAVRLIRELRRDGVRVGVASSSENTTYVLEHANLSDLFESQVDGVVSEQLHLRGKPHPEIFLTCLHQLGIDDPSCAMVAEDAVAGVEAGRAGCFGLVVGVDRGGNEHELYEHGADWVVSDFSRVTTTALAEALAQVRLTKKPAAT